jgi:serine/threonine protein kinase
MDKNDQKLLMDEIKILRKMDHINIIKLYDVFYYKKFFYVVT